MGPEEVGPAQVGPDQAGPDQAGPPQITFLARYCIVLLFRIHPLCKRIYVFADIVLRISILGVFGLDASGVVESFVGADGASGAELQLIIRAEANIKSIPAVKGILCIFMGHSLLHPLIV